MKLLLLLICVSCGSAKLAERVLYDDVTALTFYEGKMANAGRSSPIPQLQCVGGAARGRAHPSAVQCYRTGSGGGNDVQWKCQAEMDARYKFGTVNVNCEGYEYPDDPYILKGSCGLEYTLDYTQRGAEQPHHQDSYHQQDSYTQQRPRSYRDSEYYRSNYASGGGGGDGGNGTMMFFIFVGLAVFVAMYWFKPSTGGAGGSSGQHTGGGGYTGGYNEGYSSGGTGQTGFRPPGYGSYRPGFFSGMLGGAGLGYLFGRRGGGYGGYNRFGGGGYGGGGYGGSSFGGSSYGGGGHSGYSGGGGGGGGGGGSSTHTSTGFGGSSRR